MTRETSAGKLLRVGISHGQFWQTNWVNCRACGVTPTGLRDFTSWRGLSRMYEDRRDHVSILKHPLQHIHLTRTHGHADRKYTLRHTITGTCTQMQDILKGGHGDVSKCLLIQGKVHNTPCGIHGNIHSLSPCLKT